ncbi:MAG: TlpA family protein disulfide reductase [Ginsengibacter sp.]
MAIARLAAKLLQTANKLIGEIRVQLALILMVPLMLVTGHKIYAYAKAAHRSSFSICIKKITMLKILLNIEIKLLTFLLIILAYPSHSNAQAHHFTLKVHFHNPSIETLEIGEAYYYKLKFCNAAEIKVDSSNVNENTYLFEGTILYPTAVRLYPSHTGHFNKLIFIDSGYQEINIIKKGSSYIINSTTQIEKEHQEFLREMDIKTIDEKIPEKKLLSYVKNKSNSYVALFAIINQAFNYSYSATLKRINNEFDEKISQTKAFKYYTHLFAPNTIGSTAPEFSAKNIKGGRTALSSFKGQAVLLDFWASWCIPCRQMIPHLKNIYQKYHSNGLQIISISVDRDISNWKNAVKEDRVPWDNIISGYKTLDNLDMKYNVLQYPTIFLINKNGVIIGRFSKFPDDSSESALDEKLKEVFKPS